MFINNDLLDKNTLPSMMIYNIDNYITFINIRLIGCELFI